MATGFEPIQTKDEVLNRVQAQLKTAIGALAKGLLVKAKLTDRFVVTNQYQNLAHELGRTPTGWILVSPWQLETVCEDDPANNPDPAKFLRVKASGTLQCAFLVF